MAAAKTAAATKPVILTPQSRELSLPPHAQPMRLSYGSWEEEKVLHQTTAQVGVENRRARA